MNIDTIFAIGWDVLVVIGLFCAHHPLLAFASYCGLLIWAFGGFERAEGLA